MESRFEHTPPEEQQGWGNYARPPLYGQQPEVRREQPPVALCARVRDMLPSLLENDGEIRPEMTASLYAHLAACPGCALEFDEMQRVVRLVETLKPVEMPMDFSGIILRRIQTEYGPVRSGPHLGPTEAASSVVYGEVAASAETFRPKLAGQNDQLNAQGWDLAQPATSVSAATAHTARAAQTSVTSEARTQVAVQSESRTQRLTVCTLTCALMVLFVNTAWGREMLGANFEQVRLWLQQVVGALRRVPVLQWLVAAVVSTLAQVHTLLADTYHNLGATASQGLAVDIGLCAVAYYLLVARHRPVRRTY